MDCYVVKIRVEPFTKQLNIYTIEKCLRDLQQRHPSDLEELGSTTMAAAPLKIINLTMVSSAVVETVGRNTWSCNKVQIVTSQDAED